MNNKKNTNHLINVVYNSVKTTSSDKIIELKDEFDSWTKYEVILDYDKEGLVNKVTIQDK